MRQLLLAPPPSPPAAFGNFHADAAPEPWAWLQREPLDPMPVLLWGSSGVGKSHLLHALARALAARGQYAVAADPSLGRAQALPWVADPARVAVIIDDVDALDAAAQHAAFQSFVEATSHRIPVIAAAQRPPVDLALREDLRTRLGGGMVFHLEPPPDALVQRVLRQQAAERGVVLGDEALAYLLTHCQRNLGTLGALVERLDVLALSEHRRAITIPLIKALLAEERAA